MGIEEALNEIEQHLKDDPMPQSIIEESLPRLTPDELAWAGELLFGRNWKTELAERLGWRDASRIRAMMRGARPIPAGATREVLNMLKNRSFETAQHADAIAEKIAKHSRDLLEA